MTGLTATLGRALCRNGSAMLRLLDPETAHDLAIVALKAGLIPAVAPSRDPRLQTTVAGLSFANPLGLAAGFDKNGEVIDPTFRLGFGFTEIGTVTPLAQDGNPRPRLFRLAANRAVINRMGFNNHGAATLVTRLATRQHRPAPVAGVLGINVGANKLSTDRGADYTAGITAFAPFADYLAVNVSSPNTPGLRDLQARDALNELLGRAIAARDEVAGATGRPVPVFLKIAPDLDRDGLDDVVTVATDRRIDGLIISNTTLARDGLGDAKNNEAGGLSGRPLFERSTAMLAYVRRAVGPGLPIIGVGGISNSDEAWEKLAAGANLVQLLSAMIYAGAGLAAEILDGLSQRMDREGLSQIGEISGSRTAEWATRW